MIGTAFAAFAVVAIVMSAIGYLFAPVILLLSSRDMEATADDDKL